MSVTHRFGTNFERIEHSALVPQIYLLYTCIYTPYHTIPSDILVYFLILIQFIHLYIHNTHHIHFMITEWNGAVIVTTFVVVIIAHHCYRHYCYCWLLLLLVILVGFLTDWLGSVVAALTRRSVIIWWSRELSESY